MVKMRRGEAKAMNYWLRARVLTQGLTIAAIVGGSYAYGQTKQQNEARAAAEQDVLLATAAQERAEFQVRLAAAEEAHRIEEEEMARGGRGSALPAGAGQVQQAGGGWFSWFGGGGYAKREQGAPEPPKTNEPLLPPSGVSSAPAGVDMVRSPVADSDATPPSSKGVWERLGWGSGSDKKS